MPGKYDAYILDVEGKFLVRPAVAALEGGSGKRFRIRNLTEYEAEIELDSALNGTKKTAPANGGFADFVVNPRADGAYPYEVWLLLAADVKLRVPGESDPVIIIDPPNP
jgi:hypothetical protein